MEVRRSPVDDVNPRSQICQNSVVAVGFLSLLLLQFLATRQKMGIVAVLRNVEMLQSFATGMEAAVLRSQL